MKTKSIIYIIAAAFCSMSLMSCDKFLDVNPDNRADVDTEDKVKSLLVTAYPSNDHIFITEYMSDNVDEFSNTNTTRFLDQIYNWEDITESDNESPERYWRACYASVATANTALKAIEDMGGPTTTLLQECKGEALMARAYAHFMLVNVFALNYNTTSSEKDLGIAYMYDTDTRIGQVRERESVAEVYRKIDKDIQEALPLIGDSHLSVPKYHFNKKAAYAFATRFYLFYEKWDQAVKYANLCLGTSPKTMLRDWSSYKEMTATREAYTLHYVETSLNCNLLMMTAYSNLGLAFGNWSSFKKYAHGPYLDAHETSKAQNIWGTATFYDGGTKVYSSGTATYNIFWRLPYLFEYTDPVAGTGYRRTIYPALTTDEVLLNRAEAYIMLKQYDNAAADLTTWMQNIIETNLVLTPTSIQSFYQPIAYSYDADGLTSTIKKHLNPAFTIDAEGSVQESMLQCLLGFKRIETLQVGLRWFDIKRYGIEIIRRKMGADGSPSQLTDKMTKDDKRRAIQLPQTVVDAGVTPNPR